METLAFNWANGPSILHMLVEHLQIVAVGVGFAILTGVPLGSPSVSTNVWRASCSTSLPSS
ncbi:L-proline glycine betaine ABC transport system permease protein ProW [Caballeronia sordidicola]|uniref:L-proline glycine betaine ABC transport system permease protein ProW n=1 Tax=Caballeronia sordidicola TaxID=196367 RepID=A0A226WQ31_CABSO|nr:L-proline glycine betaine ABC transport system permease protein ProW [Caballeronia sordidicola]